MRGMGAVLTTHACVAGSACSVRLSAGSSMKHSTPRLVSAKTCVVEGSRAASSTHLVRARVTVTLTLTLTLTTRTLSRAASSTHAKMAALSESDPCSRDE